MDGNFRSENQSREDIIKSWMLSALQDGGIDRFDDIHIDQIDHKWREKERWVLAGLEAFDIGLKLRDDLQLPVDLALAFSLESGPEPRGVDFRTPAELQTTLDWSPPSLYLLYPHIQPWAESGRSNADPSPDIQTVMLDPQFIGTTPKVKGCYYLEFRSEDSSHYSRAIWLVG